MASSSRINVTENTSKENIFISWKEKLAIESKANRRIEFFLQLQNFRWILAVVGVVTDFPHMEFTIDPTFNFNYKLDVTGFGKGVWKRRCYVVDWLRAQISNVPFKENIHMMFNTENTEDIPQVMDASFFGRFIDSEAANGSLAFPSGYSHSYSIPSRAQLVLKHGARNFEVLVEEGCLTKGWNYFVREHEIREGYGVEFHFVGCSTYEVDIFDWNRNKMAYPWSNLEYHEWV